MCVCERETHTIGDKKKKEKSSSKISQGLIFFFFFFNIQWLSRRRVYIFLSLFFFLGKNKRIL